MICSHGPKACNKSSFMYRQSPSFTMLVDEAFHTEFTSFSYKNDLVLEAPNTGQLSLVFSVQDASTSSRHDDI